MKINYNLLSGKFLFIMVLSKHAVEQIDREKPYAIMGLFDISQRSIALKDYLSMTIPYKLWENS